MRRARLTRRLLPPALALIALVTTGAAPAWRQEITPAAGRLIAIAQPQGQSHGDILTVVIEGDGRAHDAHGRPTADPTPSARPGYDLARAWPQGPVAWVGRLCQFTRQADPACGPADWTTARFSQGAVNAASAAIDQLKARAGAARVRLVGWSGGGVIAALLAQQRSDVAGLITFAAPLDTRAWTDGQRLTPLSGSLNPADRAMPAATPQVHLLGSGDTVAPPAILQGPLLRLAPPGRVLIRPERHECCWTREIPLALRTLGGA